MRRLLGLGLGLVAYLVFRRQPRHMDVPTPSAVSPEAVRVVAVVEPRSTGRASRWLAAGAAVCLIGAGLLAYWGAQFVPPTYDLGNGEPTGSVQVFVSDPSVTVQLDVNIFDIDWTHFDATGTGQRPGQPVPSPKIILWLRGDKHEVIDWAVIFQGTARYRHPNLGADGLQLTDGHPTGGNTRIVGDMQVVEGRAEVGPHAFTERPMDWFDEAVGPFWRRSGSWPSYGSKSVVALPAFGGSSLLQAAGLGPRLVPASATLEVSVGLWVGPPGRFLRIDGEEPPLDPRPSGETDARYLNWSAPSFPAGIDVLYTDVAAETNESSHALLAGVLLGMAGTALFTAVTVGARFLLAALAAQRGSRPPS